MLYLLWAGSWRARQFTCPDWYITVKAAQFYHMSPEDVEEMPLFWIHAAFAAQECESVAQREYEKMWPNGRPDLPSWRRARAERED